MNWLAGIAKLLGAATGADALGKAGQQLAPQLQRAGKALAPAPGGVGGLLFPPSRQQQQAPQQQMQRPQLQPVPNLGFTDPRMQGPMTEMKRRSYMNEAIGMPYGDYAVRPDFFQQLNQPDQSNY